VKSPRLRGAAAAVACALALSSCGPVHPGEAAQVGGTLISDDTLERSTNGFCDLIAAVNAAQQGTTPPVPVRQALLSALNTLVMGEALDQLARRRGVEVTSAEIRRWVDAIPIDLSQVPPGRAADLRMVIDRVARNSLLIGKLGRQVYAQQNPGTSAAPPEHVQQLGQELASDYLQRVDVATNPRYGRVLDMQRLPGTGSLSVAVSPQGVAAQSVPEPTSELNETQECF
jgi:SurA N-terminal domain